jgi:hypothetical protein
VRRQRVCTLPFPSAHSQSRGVIVGKEDLWSNFREVQRFYTWERPQLFLKRLPLFGTKSGELHLWGHCWK